MGCNRGSRGGNRGHGGREWEKGAEGDLSRRRWSSLCVLTWWFSVVVVREKSHENGDHRNQNTEIRIPSCVRRVPTVGMKYWITHGKSHRTRKLTVSGQIPLVQRVLMSSCVLCCPGTIARFVCEPVGAVRFVRNTMRLSPPIPRLCPIFHFSSQGTTLGGLPNLGSQGAVIVPPSKLTRRTNSICSHPSQKQPDVPTQSS
jgi:hypothetical protein